MFKNKYACGSLLWWTISQRLTTQLARVSEEEDFLYDEVKMKSLNMSGVPASEQE